MMSEINWVLTDKQKKYINNRDRVLVVEGSAGSGKTLFAVHKTILYAMEHENARIGVFRYTLPSLRQTSWKEIRARLNYYKIPFKENKSDGTITLFNDAEIMFKSLDDLNKIRSLNLDYIYVEQAEEIDRDTYIELDRRLRGNVGAKDYSQTLLVVTPESEAHWIYQLFHKPDEDGEYRGTVVHFHYSENDFLPKHYLKGYEDLKQIDEELYRKYTEGKWGKLTNIIYENWDNKRLKRGVEYYTAGADFGFNNPSSFLLVAWYDGEPYVVDEIYQKGLTNYEFMDKIKSMLNGMKLKPNQITKVYADSAEPDRIEEFCNEGFDCVPANKSVTDGIEAVRRTKVHIYKECINTLKEIKSYKYDKDKDGNILDKPIKFNDHSMDALRYCIYGTIGIRSVDTPELEYEECYVM